ncbi:hypothetical protein CSE45_2191 [Citreicella sp. SE45]|nr:hypothetical protein CSE45_2191 [Citreicella sp. SE45]
MKVQRRRARAGRKKRLRKVANRSIGALLTWGDSLGGTLPLYMENTTWLVRFLIS